MPELASQLASARRIDERTFELRVTNTPGLVSWALSQKTDVVILAPDEIRRQAADVLRGLV
jgi:hypothetical protein